MILELRKTIHQKKTTTKIEETLPKLEELKKGDPKEETKEEFKTEDEILRCRKEIIADGQSAPKYQQNDGT